MVVAVEEETEEQEGEGEGEEDQEGGWEDQEEGWEQEAKAAVGTVVKRERLWTEQQPFLNCSLSWRRSPLLLETTTCATL